MTGTREIDGSSTAWSPGPEATSLAPRGCIVCGEHARRPFRHQDGFAIVACQGCDLRFLNPQPSEAELDALYGESYFASHDSRRHGYDGYAADAENWRRTFRDRLRHLPAERGRLLDVGAATGFFVEQARAAGWDATGVEPSEWAAAHAREQLGLDVRTGTLDRVRYPDGAFDVVTMWEVIEHVRDPRAVLAEVRRILGPRGTLVLSTPDCRSAAARLAGRRWLGWRKVPEHLWFFDRVNLDRLLVQAGFRPVRHRYPALTVSAGFAVERLAAVLGLPAWVRAPARLARRSIRVNPFYDLLVVARKR